LIYLDHNSTTPVDADVLQAMLPFFSNEFGNPASHHLLGERAAAAVEASRRNVAELLGCSAQELIFTSGATESNNLALKGCFRTGCARRVIIHSSTEHKAVFEPANALAASSGAIVQVAPVLRSGVVDLPALRSMLTNEVAVVSIMSANNETGAINPIGEIAEMTRSAGAQFHVDAAQSAGKLEILLANSNIDLLSISSHKIYGPKGVGALFVRRGVILEPLLHGGGHERGQRSGTLNVSGIVGFGEAARIARSRLPDYQARTKSLRDMLESLLRDRIRGVEFNGPLEERLCNTVNLRFVGADAEAVLLNAPSVAASTGSACTSNSPTPSHVLLAMGLSHQAAEESIRFSLGRDTTESDVENAAQAIACAVDRVRTMACSGEEATTR
jgi:cysteine desulfurase